MSAATAVAAAPDAIVEPASAEKSTRRASLEVERRRVLIDGPYERCLLALLSALGWGGEPRHLMEATPHLAPLTNEAELRICLERLGFKLMRVSLAPSELERAPFPAFFIANDAPMIALGIAERGALRAFDGALGEEREYTPESTTVFWRVSAPLSGENDAERIDDAAGWSGQALRRFNPELRFVAGLTLIANVLALGAPLFTMAIYNAVIPSQQLHTLGFLVAIAALALLAEHRVRKLRAQVISETAARADWAMLTTAFARILYLPIQMLEAATVSSQIGRLRQFESTLGAMSGSLAAALFDLPFAIVFVIAVGVIAGPLIWIPLVTMGLFLILHIALGFASADVNRRVAKTRERAEAVLRDTLDSVDAIRGLGAEAGFRDRAAESLRASVAARLQAQRLEQFRQSGAQLLLGLSTVVTLWAGALLVIDNALTVGALIAVTLLNGRLLGPAQSLFLAGGQIQAAVDSARQVDGLMRLQTDRAIDTAPSVYRRFGGRVQFREVSFRHQGADDFALRGVSLDLEAGSALGIVGPAGSGRSTLLRLALGLYRPTAGQLLFDGLNASQVEPAELRAAIAFAPGEPEFFYGTLAQNMALARATVTDTEIQEVFEELGIELDPRLFPEGLSTRLGGHGYAQAPEALRQKLSLARALVKNASVTLLENPGAFLGEDCKARLRAALEARKGRTTVLMSTHDPSLLKLCDKLLGLSGGVVTAYGPPDLLLNARKATEDTPE